MATCHGCPAGPGVRLRAHGPWRPDRGHRFNPRKLLLDPWAREIVGAFDWGPEHFGHDGDHPLQPDPRDNAATALKARVVHDSFDWGGDRPPRTPLADSVLYELHVRGFTARHPGVPEPLRGTYAGLAQPMPCSPPAAPGHHRRQPAAGAPAPGRTRLVGRWG
jgi:pullulanase/glycogen debranching enzyme